MKDFLITFIMVLVILVIFFFFGGVVILDFKNHFWLAIFFCGFVISLILYYFAKLYIKVEELENKIEQLNSEKKDV